MNGGGCSSSSSSCGSEAAEGAEEAHLGGGLVARELRQQVKEGIYRLLSEGSEASSLGQYGILTLNLNSSFTPLRIEKGGAVPYRDLVTILRPALMQYHITKLAMLQSQKPPVSPPPNYKVMYL